MIVVWIGVRKIERYLLNIYYKLNIENVMYRVYFFFLFLGIGYVK